MKYVIIGNSAAGVSAAQEIRRLDSSGEILIISKEKEPVYSRCLLPDYIGGELSKQQLFIRDPDFYIRHNIKTLFATEVIDVLPENRRVLLGDGSQIKYDRLLLATGGKPFLPPIPGLTELEPVYTLNTMADADQILKDSEGMQNIAVLGGGFIGLELAFALNKRNRQVTVIEIQERILVQQLDAKAGALMQAEIQKSGIKLLVQTGVAKVVTNPMLKRLFGQNALKGLALTDGSFLPCDMLIVCAGTLPNIDLVRDTGIKWNKGILVDAHMATNIDGIYAAGDAAESIDAVTDQRSLSPIWPNAVLQGKFAGSNMAGWKRQFIPQVSMQNTSEFRDIPFISVGIIAPPENSGYDMLTYHNVHKGVYRKIVLKDNVPVGMIFMGDITNAGTVAGFIRHRKDASKVKHAFLSDRYSYARQITEYKN